LVELVVWMDRVQRSTPAAGISATEKAEPYRDAASVDHLFASVIGEDRRLVPLPRWSQDVTGGQPSAASLRTGSRSDDLSTLFLQDLVDGVGLSFV
jgi:hypothetical protein